MWKCNWRIFLSALQVRWSSFLAPLKRGQGLQGLDEAKEQKVPEKFSLLWWFQRGAHKFTYLFIQILNLAEGQALRCEGGPKYIDCLVNWGQWRDNLSIYLELGSSEVKASFLGKSLPEKETGIQLQVLVFEDRNWYPGSTELVAKDYRRSRRPRYLSDES